MKYFTPQTLVIMGLMFEIVGALLLTLEAFGKEQLAKYLAKYERVVEWSKKSLFRTFLVTIPPLAPLLYLAIIGNEVYMALYFPFLLSILFTTTVFDNSKLITDFIKKRHINKGLSPKGFILLLIGNVLQIVSSLITIG